MEHPRIVEHEPTAIVPPESLVSEIVRMTPPDAEYAMGMDILVDSGGTLRVGKVVCTTWEDCSTYIAVFSDGGRQTLTVDEALVLHNRWLATPDVTPIRVSIVDKHLGWQFEANEEDMRRTLERSAFPDSVVVEYAETENRSPVGVSVAQKYRDQMHIGICFGKQVIGGQLIYLVIFDDGVVKAMSYRVMKRAVERFAVGRYVPIVAVL